MIEQVEIDELKEAAVKKGYHFHIFRKEDECLMARICWPENYQNKSDGFQEYDLLDPNDLKRVKTLVAPNPMLMEMIVFRPLEEMKRTTYGHHIDDSEYVHWNHSQTILSIYTPKGCGEMNVEVDTLTIQTFEPGKETTTIWKLSEVIQD